MVTYSQPGKKERMTAPARHEQPKDAPPIRVDVWSWPVTPSGRWPMAWLSEEEETALARLRAPERRERARTAWAVRRLLLSRALACPPESVILARTSSGAPVVVHPQAPCAISFAHSGDWAYLALSRWSAVGVDVERVNAKIDSLGLARRFGTPEEAKLLSALSPAARAATFFRIWSRKEAVLKATGGGVPSRLRDVRVPCGLSGGRAGLRASDTAWHVQDLVAPPGYVAALATPRAASVVEHLVEPSRLLTA